MFGFDLFFSCGVFGKNGVYLNIYVWSYVPLCSVDSNKLKPVTNSIFVYKHDLIPVNNTHRHTWQL